MAHAFRDSIANGQWSTHYRFKSPTHHRLLGLESFNPVSTISNIGSKDIYPYNQGCDANAEELKMNDGLYQVEPYETAMLPVMAINSITGSVATPMDQLRCL